MARKRRNSATSTHPPSSDRSSEPAEEPREGVGVWLWRWTKRLFVLGVVLGLAAAAALWWTLKSYEKGLPSTAELRDYHPPQVTRVLGRDGTVLAELFVQRRTVVSIELIPKEMKLAALAAEDADF